MLIGANTLKFFKVIINEYVERDINAMGEILIADKLEKQKLST